MLNHLKKKMYYVMFNTNLKHIQKYIKKTCMKIPIKLQYEISLYEKTLSYKEIFLFGIKERMPQRQDTPADLGVRRHHSDSTRRVFL